MEANNGIHTTNQAHVVTSPDTPSMIYSMLMKTGYFVLRLYVTCLLVIYHWAVGLVDRAIEPFRPIAEQVQKVPKKDISATGVFYQFLRLSFLCFLYISPVISGALAVATQPLVTLKESMEEFVKDGQTNKKLSD